MVLRAFIVFVLGSMLTFMALADVKAQGSAKTQGSTKAAADRARIAQVLAEDMDAIGQDRFVGMTDASSKCIGDPRTPVCAFETELACELRRPGGECYLFGFEFIYGLKLGEVLRDIYIGPEVEGGEAFYRYRILKVRALKVGDHDVWPYCSLLCFMPGDVKLILRGPLRYVDNGAPVYIEVRLALDRETSTLRVVDADLFNIDDMLRRDLRKTSLYSRTGSERKTRGDLLRNTRALRADRKAIGQARFISMTDATSKCIGTLNTPLCTLESSLACAMREPDGHCIIKGQHLGGGKLRDKSILTYKILRVRQLTKREEYLEYECGSECARAGDFQIIYRENLSENCQDFCNSEARFMWAPVQGTPQWKMYIHGLM